MKEEQDLKRRHDKLTNHFKQRQFLVGRCGACMQLRSSFIFVFVRRKNLGRQYHGVQLGRRGGKASRDSCGSVTVCLSPFVLRGFVCISQMVCVNKSHKAPNNAATIFGTFQARTLSPAHRSPMRLVEVKSRQFVNKCLPLQVLATRKGDGQKSLARHGKALLKLEQVCACAWAYYMRSLTNV